MTEFVEENSRTIDFDIEDIPDSLIYKLPEVEFTYGPERFGVGEYLNIEYYERLFERKHPGLLQQFPCLYYMVEDWHREATKKTPLDEIEERKNK
jgi:hypothetical protein